MIRHWVINPEDKTIKPFKIKDIPVLGDRQIADGICVDVWRMYQTPVSDGMMYHAPEPRDNRGFSVGGHTFRGLSIYQGYHEPKLEWVE